MRSYYLLGGLAAAGLVGWLAYGQWKGGMVVEAARVSRNDIREFIDEQGKTRLPQTWLISMPFQGRVDSLMELAEGASVSKGQTVARVTEQDLDLAVDAAQAAVDRAQAAIDENDDVTVEATTLLQTRSFVESMVHAVQAAEERVKSGAAKRDFAVRNLERATELFEQSDTLVSEREFNLAQLREVESKVDFQQDVLVHAALLAMKAGTDLSPALVQQYMARKQLASAVKAKEKLQAEIKLQEALRDRERGRMVSPVTGVVLRREESSERFLPAGAVLLEIGQMEQLEVEADVLSQDVVNLPPQAEADIYGPAIGPRPARAQVVKIYPAGFTKISSLGVEQQRVKVILRLAAEELARLRTERGLGVGYRVQVRIFTAARSAALVVPRSALLRGAAGDWQVFAIRAGRARLSAVKVGLLNDEAAEIVEGLAEDEMVVLAPETDLTDGARVQPIVRE